MAVSIIAIKLIGPEKLGMWQAALLIKPYVAFLQLGLTQGLGRQIPFLLGQKNDYRVRQYASNAQFVTTLYTLTCAIIAVALTFFLAEGINEKLIYITAGIFIATMFVDNYLSSTYRSSKSFANLAKVYFVASIFEILLLPLIYYYGFNGYMIILLLHSIFSTSLLIYFRPIKVASKFNKDIFFENIKIGFPMVSLDFLRSIPDTYPKIFILYFLSTTALGLTSPANAALAAFAVLPASLAKYVYPNMTFNFGKTANKLKLWQTSKKLSGLLTGIGLVGLFSIFIIPYAVENFFPKYVEAISITKIALFIAFFRMFTILFTVFNTLKAYKIQFIVSLIRNICYLIFPLLFYYFASTSQQLEFIFLGVLVAEFLYVVALFYFIFRVTHNKLSYDD
ncbi:polysaccharide biosynthesis protein [Salegentibacter echinorum]|nr:hypothetical protein [Salegentibacter echinorum]